MSWNLDMNTPVFNEAATRGYKPDFASDAERIRANGAWRLDPQNVPKPSEVKKSQDRTPATSLSAEWKAARKRRIAEAAREERPTKAWERAVGR